MNPKGVICMTYEYKKLRELREDSDYTQKQIAEKLNEHLTTYQRWERGETEIPTHILKALCEFYGVSADYILGLPENLKYPKR